jgi:hypothetical protein
MDLAAPSGMAAQLDRYFRQEIVAMLDKPTLFYDKAALLRASGRAARGAR